MFCYLFFSFFYYLSQLPTVYSRYQKFHNFDVMLLLFAAASCRFGCAPPWLHVHPLVPVYWPLSLFPDLHCLLPSALEFGLDLTFRMILTSSQYRIFFFFFFLKVRGYMFCTVVSRQEGHSFKSWFLIGNSKNVHSDNSSDSIMSTLCGTSDCCYSQPLHKKLDSKY